MAMVIRYSSEVSSHAFAVLTPLNNCSAVVVALAWLILRSGLLRCKDRTSKQQPRGMGLV